MNQTVTYLQELTAIPSPTGFTREIADYLVKTIEGFGYEVTRTAKGGVNVTVPGVITDKQRYVTAHVDTLGAIVRAVKADGRLKDNFGPSDFLPCLQGCWNCRADPGQYGSPSG